MTTDPGDSGTDAGDSGMNTGYSGMDAGDSGLNAGYSEMDTGDSGMDMENRFRNGNTREWENFLMLFLRHAKALNGQSTISHPSDSK